MADGRLIVFNGRGSRSYPNPQRPKPIPQRPLQCIPESIRFKYVGGDSGRIGLRSYQRFDDDQLDKYSWRRQVYANSPYRDDLLDMDVLTSPPAIRFRRVRAIKRRSKTVIFILQRETGHV